MRRFCLIEFLYTISFVVICGALDETLTVTVSPGGRECFFEEISANSQYEIEYQVVSGGELDISFTIDTAGETGIFENVKKSSNVYSFSHISTKTVFFRITVTEDVTTTGRMDEAAEAEELLPFEITLENFQMSTHQVGNNLQRSVEIQRAFSQSELRDRSIQEYNFERVNFWSGLHLFVMVSVALVNVLMIRSLFSDKHSTSSSASKLRT